MHAVGVVQGTNSSISFELMAEAQRDITPEQSAHRLRGCSDLHYLGWWNTANKYCLVELILFVVNPTSKNPYTEREVGLGLELCLDADCNYRHVNGVGIHPDEM